VAVSVAVIGCGTVARSYYAPALRRLIAEGRVGSVRLFDVSAARANDLATGLPASTVAPSWDHVLKAADDLAVVASSPVVHAEQVRALLEHGKHVLCEKPFALGRGTAGRLADLARETGLVCAVGMVRRFARSACLLRQLLSEERPTRLAWREGGPFRWPVESPAYFAPGTGNQLLWDVGSHLLDLLVWWLGPPRLLSCSDDAMGGMATNCLLELEWPDGCRGEVRLSREYDLSSGLVIERPSGSLVCGDVTELDVLMGTGAPADPGFRQAIPGTSSPAGRTFLDCFDVQLENVLAAVRGSAELWVRADDVLDGINALAETDAAGELLESPWFSADEVTRARALHDGAREAARP